MRKDLQRANNQRSLHGKMKNMLVSNRIQEGEWLEIRLEGSVRSCSLGFLVANPSLNCLTWARKIGIGRSSSEQREDRGSSAWKVVPGASGAGRSLIPTSSLLIGKELLLLLPTGKNSKEGHWTNFCHNQI